ncbi:unnamed protein product [Ilex paraguariensis]|uniref:C-JID domain-containing protein n=1 Tax=Ilex paraguariensis TaxID=185542 RepID=A0ABC8TLB4_9AQUA
MKKVNLSECPRLQHLQWPSVAVDELNVTDCRSLKTITRLSLWDSARRIEDFDCPSLCEFEYDFKMEDVGKVDLQVINNIGFFNLDSMANVDLRIINRHASGRMKCPAQIMWDNYMFNTYFPGREVPHWFSYKITGSTISFTLPSFPFLKVKALNLCLVYKIPGIDIDDQLPAPICVRLSNKSKCLDWTYTPRCYGVPEADEDMVWLFHWHWGWPIPFEEGDEVHASFDIEIDGEIKECGVHVLHYEEEEEVFNCYKTLSTFWDSNSMRVMFL